MFTLDQDITVPKLREKNLVKVFFSMNNHQVATPEMMLEEASSYVMFYGEDDGKVAAYIGLYLLLTDRRLFFAHSSNPFPPGEMGLAVLEHENAKAELKKLMPEDAKEAIGHGIRAKRSRSGAVSFELNQVEADHAPLQ